MKKVKRRSACALLLAICLVLGLGVYVVKYAVSGGTWASASFNQHSYTDGILTTGRVYDRNGVELAGVTEGGYRSFHSDATVRRATLHAVGDLSGNIGTGALRAFSSQLAGYNPVTGLYSLSGTGNNLYLTIDSDLNVVAYNALAGRKGTIAVYNYETGEVLCMVSSPTFDPTTPEEVVEGDSQYEGAYLNRFLSSTFVPGSIFKLVTTAAAIEQIPDIYSREWNCNGSLDVGGDTITCTGTHGSVNIEDALAVSCNCAFAQISLELGAETLYAYAQQMGLLDSLSINGIDTAAGEFQLAEDGTADLAWSGIGQYQDLVNPCSMLQLMGAIAGGGKAARPRLISRLTTSSGFPAGIYTSHSSGRLLSEETAEALEQMMSYNVAATYGAGNFPGLDICAKSGTAEVGGDASPHAWFVGFIRNEDYPLAFVVLVENGGSGSGVAGGIANTVLQAAIAQ